MQAAFEKVVSAFDPDQFLRIRESFDQRFESTGGTELITRSADKKFWFRACTEEFEIIDAVFYGDGRQAESDERRYPPVGMDGAQSYGGSKGKSGKDNRELEFVFEPVEGGAYIFDFADPVGVLAFAQASAAEIEAEHGKSKTVQRLHGVEGNLVVERSTVERMRMTHQGSVRRAGRSGIE